MDRDTVLLFSMIALVIAVFASLYDASAIAVRGKQAAALQRFEKLIDPKVVRREGER